MKYLIGILSLIIAGILIFVYIQISRPDNYKSNPEVKKHEIKFSKPFDIKKPEFSYLFPARVLYMKIDFRKFNYNFIYKITLKGFDTFALFNIKTILNNYHIHYSILEKKKTKIYIFFKNIKEANLIFNLFKEYNFNIKIQKIQK